MRVSGWTVTVRFVPSYTLGAWGPSARGWWMVVSSPLGDASEPGHWRDAFTLVSPLSRVAELGSRAYLSGSALFCDPPRLGGVLQCGDLRSAQAHALRQRVHRSLPCSIHQRPGPCASLAQELVLQSHSAPPPVPSFSHSPLGSDIRGRPPIGLCVEIVRICRSSALSLSQASLLFLPSPVLVCPVELITGGSGQVGFVPHLNPRAQVSRRPRSWF